MAEAAAVEAVEEEVAVGTAAMIMVMAEGTIAGKFPFDSLLSADLPTCMLPFLLSTVMNRWFTWVRSGRSLDLSLSHRTS